jgi:hypothetical protein
MSSRSFVATATLAAFLSAAAAPVSAQTQTPQASPLRASIDRAASTTTPSPTLPQRRSAPVRKAAMQGGGGGGMMVMTLIGTVAGLAATYFVVKEMKKQTDAASNTAQ